MFDIYKYCVISVILRFKDLNSPEVCQFSIDIADYGYYRLPSVIESLNYINIVILIFLNFLCIPDFL